MDKLQTGDRGMCTESGVTGHIIKFYVPTASEPQIMVQTDDGRQYHAPYRTWRKIDNTPDAIKKQVPQKVIETPDKHRYGHCPICGRIYWDKCHVGNYCDNCGQALEV